jgi:SOS-response transcriptional repressor LexA
MNKNVQNTLEAFDKSIAELQKARERFIGKLPLSSKVKKYDWVIDTRTNSHSQFIETLDSIINLTKYTGTRTLSISQFDADFVLATPEQVENHLRYLNGRGLWYVGRSVIEDVSGSLKSESSNKLESLKPKVQLPEFYMITVEGKSGAIVRHPDFQTAANEATRLAKKCNHRAHIMGVVAIVEPVEVQKPITEYQLIKK